MLPNKIYELFRGIFTASWLGAFSSFILLFPAGAFASFTYGTPFEFLAELLFKFLGVSLVGSLTVIALLGIITAGYIVVGAFKNFRES